MKGKRPLIVGTIAFDVIFSIDPSINKEVDAIYQKSSMNLSFVAKQSTILYGGTAGNIGYTLGILGKKPIVFSVVGKDFITSGYETFLREKGVELAVECFEDQNSASCYQISDENTDQITIWQSNAYDKVDEIGLNEKVKDAAKSINVAIFSAGNPIGTLYHMKELSELNPQATIIFDPGTRVYSHNKEQFQEGLDCSDILIVNEAELQKVFGYGFSERELLAKHVECIIVTLGPHGSLIKTNNQVIKIEAVKPDRVIETTGAGDAYRGGLIAGLLEGKDLEESARIGSVVASYCIEDKGGQSHEITWNDIKKRL
ncbi:MAG: PfkB family carbohydrate kinase [Candidatus Hodarchaeales archaeon]|jgi:adenosine kinase